ncbi:MAG: hypothetical protein Q8O33_14130 [Pseudomonadota bacterium]|nr:hypothetical protein [Pseudomonadota bacterium]
MPVSHRTRTLLQGEVMRIQSWLDRFDPPFRGGQRRATLGRTDEYIVVKHFPLPDWCHPDYLDLLLLVDRFPARPPVGLYLLNEGNETLVQQISRRHHAFKDQGFHDAPSIAGFTWICFHYPDNTWRYDIQTPARSDNLSKFVQSFYAELA